MPQYKVSIEVSRICIQVPNRCICIQVYKGYGNHAKVVKATVHTARIEVIRSHVKKLAISKSLKVSACEAHAFHGTMRPKACSLE